LQPSSPPHPAPRTPANTPKIAAQCNIDDENFFKDNEIQEHYIGPMDGVCEHCGARYWKAEQTTAGSITFAVVMGLCAFHLSLLPPEITKELLLGVTPKATHF
jgi:hypothetical protein